MLHVASKGPPPNPVLVLEAASEHPAPQQVQGSVPTWAEWYQCGIWNWNIRVISRQSKLWNIWKPDLEISSIGYLPKTLLARSSMHSAAGTMSKGGWPHVVGNVADVLWCLHSEFLTQDAGILPQSFVLFALCVHGVVDKDCQVYYMKALQITTLRLFH